MTVQYTKRYDFLIGIDSDGCAFDTMELKHKECFIPNSIRFFELQGVSKYAREALEFVNLYSQSRGINRFPALTESLTWLAQRPEVRARGVTIDTLAPLQDWMRSETKLGNPALKAAAERTGNETLWRALAWSEAVNETVDLIVGDGVPPFPMVRESLEAMEGRADVLVVSATPQGALQREWENQGLLRFIAAICGQEVGTKKESLAVAASYPPNHTLMIGDAPGDHQAAVANKSLFFPINPGDEEASWKQLADEGLERFFTGTFAGDYQAALLDQFRRCLPERPPWERA